MAGMEDFMRLFMPIQGDLLAYILAMGVAPRAADDVLQNAATAMLQNIESFQLGTNFRAWAYAVTKNHAFHAVRAQTQRTLVLSEEALSDIESLTQSEADADPLPSEALTVCLEKLPKPSKQLVDMRYRENLNVAEIARRLNRPAESISTLLSRIRRGLLECVRRTQQMEASPP